MGRETESFRLRVWKIREMLLEGFRTEMGDEE